MGSDRQGVRFDLTQVPAPASAGGTALVTKEQAIETAITHSVGTIMGNLRPNVHMAARFGYFSDDQYAQIMPDGTRHPFFQQIPVWLVTFSGVNRLPIGGPPPVGADRAQLERDLQSQAFQEENIVIDASNCQYLMKYGFR